MRLGIWNTGEYEGYPDDPDLQLRWFTDQAAAVRQTRLAAGRPDPLSDDGQWGEWIADVGAPAEAVPGPLPAAARATRAS